MDAEETGAVAPARSLADELSALREGIKKERKPRKFPLPVYGDKLIAMYKVIDIDEIEEIGDRALEANRADEDTDIGLFAMCATLISACVGFYTKRDGRTIPLEQAEAGMEGGPIRWGDPRLAKFLKTEIGTEYTAREIMQEILPDKALIIRHHNRVTNWMEQARERVDADFE